MEKQQLKKLLDVAAGRIPADLVIKNCRVVDVCGGQIVSGDIAVCDGLIAGIGTYQGADETDAAGKYALPGLIDSHIHIESSCVSPEEFAALTVPCGTATVIADPHEIVNVCGLAGLDYMLRASEMSALDVCYMLPSCVPATPFENAGAVIDAQAMRKVIDDPRINGLGEFMNVPGVVSGAPAELEKILVAHEAGKLIDGHAPDLAGSDLNAYAAMGILTDHECTTVAEMHDRLSRGMYVLLREGSACHDLERLLPGLSAHNSRRCLLCSDDRQPKTMLELGHLDNHLRLCVKNGVDPITAVQMATLNAAECYRLYDRGALTPGKRADVVLVDDLEQFRVRRVYLRGKLAAQDGKYLLPVRRCDSSAVRASFHVKDFSAGKLRQHLTSPRVHAIGLLPGGVVTEKCVCEIKLDEQGEFVFDPARDIVKLAVVERHKNTGNVASAFLRGYGLKRGAVAVSIAHDSHNIIAAGVSDAEIVCAVEAVIAQEGGIALVENGQVIARLPMPIGGIMSDRSGAWVDQQLELVHRAAFDRLGVQPQVDPVMTLCFMSLPVIPALKLTDLGLFDVTKFEFIPIEAE